MTSCFAVLTISLLLGQQPARDTTPAGARPAGTATISGTVVADEGGVRIRRARIVLTTTSGAAVRADITDDSGAFVFRDLPAGRYVLSASKPAWLTTNYGASQPRRPGTPIVVADGARVAGLTLRMIRGAVVSGVVRDVSGQPAAGVRVQVSRLSMRNGERYLEGVAGDGTLPVETDDTGAYRIFGLPPGDVIVSASLPSSQISFRDDGAAFLVNSTGPPMKPAMVFHPGTPEPNSATVFTLVAGEERNGVDLTMLLVPTSRVEGIVTDAMGAPQTRSSVVAISGGIQLGGLMGLNGALPSSTDSNGHYELIGLPPGEYTLLASGERTWAEVNIVVNGQDVNVPLTLQPMLSMSLRLVFEGGAAPPVSRLQYTTLATGRLASLMALATAGTVNLDDGARTTQGDIVPGKYQFSFRGVPDGWYPKSAIARGQDTFDFPIDVTPNDRFTEFVVTFTNTPSELAGSLVDAGGRPASEYFVVVFSTDRRYWTQPSRRIVQVRPASDGAFSIKGLPAGEYYIAALTDIEPGQSLSAEFLTSLVAATPPVRIKIVDGEKTVQPLRIGGT